MKIDTSLVDIITRAFAINDSRLIPVATTKLAEVVVFPYQLQQGAENLDLSFKTGTEHETPSKISLLPKFIDPLFTGTA